MGLDNPGWDGLELTGLRNSYFLTSNYKSVIISCQLFGFSRPRVNGSVPIQNQGMNICIMFC